LLLVYSDLLKVSILLFLTFGGAMVVSLVVGITVHEFSHAMTANRLGDDTACRLGRCSLNPMRHLDPTGTFFLLLGGFGWGKPTPVNPYRLRNGPEAGRAMVAAAGPISNILLAIIASIPIHAGLVDWRSPFFIPFTVHGWGASEYVGLFLSAIIIFNIFLAVFNLLPIAPLDGFSVAVGLLPRDLSISLARLEPYGPGIIMLLFVLPFATNGHVNIFVHVMSPVINLLTRLIGGERALA
jgi:Zn-dependent protease